MVSFIDSSSRLGVPVNSKPFEKEVQSSVKKITLSFSEAIAESLEKKVKDWVKIARYTLFFSGNAMPQLGAHLGHVKNLLSIRDFFQGIPNACTSFCDAVEERTSDAFQKAVLDCGKVFSTVGDTVEYVSAFPIVSLNAAFSAFVRKYNPAVTGLCASLYSIKELNNVWEAKDSDQQMLSLLKLATNVSYVAFAAISIGSAIMGITPAAVTIITCLASGALFGVLSSIYESMNDPYGKNATSCIKLAGRIQL